MTFEFDYQTTAQQSIDVEDIGNVILQSINVSLINSFYYESFLIIKTELGKTKIIQIGPFEVDCDDLLSICNFSYQEIDYKESKIINQIEKFINNPRYPATQINEIDIDYVKDRMKLLVNLL